MKNKFNHRGTEAQRKANVRIAMLPQFTPPTDGVMRAMRALASGPRGILALANASDLTMENLREQVRELAQGDARFLQKPDGSAEAYSGVWVQDLVAPQNGGNSWKAIIQGVDGKTYEAGFTLTDGKVVLGSDCKEVIRSVSYQPLANSVAVREGDGYRIALENSATLDDSGWVLIAPYGEHTNTRLVRLPNGQLVQQKFIQVMDAAAGTALMNSENSLFRKLRKMLVGIPIYADATGTQPHPDMAKYEPQVVAPAGVQTPVGVVDKVRLGNAGLEAHCALIPDGATAVANGAKYPSVFWEVKLLETLADGTHRVTPSKLLSVGLTPFPNISGVDSLANAKTNLPAANQNKNKDENMKALLIGWLAAQGITLANSVTEEGVLAEFQKHYNEKMGSIITLGNAKSTAEGKITALETDKTKLTGDLTTAQTALGNAQTEVKTERKGRIEALVDLAIQQGKVTIADRDSKITALGNSTDLTKDLKALADLAITIKVHGNSATIGADKSNAATAKSAQEQIITLANSDPRYKDIKDFQKAFNKVCEDHPALKEQLNTKTA